MPDPKDPQIGSVDISAVDGGDVTVGDIELQVHAGGDIVAGDKIVHVHDTRDPQRKAKPPQPFEPQTMPIAAGEFIMGAGDGQGFEAPPHRVALTAYWMGRTPVTHAQYLYFVRATNHPVSSRAGWQLTRVGKEPPAELLDHPMVGVTWDDAGAYCRWLGQETGRGYRLPTEAEWERAASWVPDPGSTHAGTQRSFPWGDAFDASLCNSGEGGPGRTTAVGHYSPQGDSGSGCADAAGNVWEWTSTLWGTDYAQPDSPYPYVHDRRESPEPHQPHREYRVCRGGSFREERRLLRCSARGREVAGEAYAHVGFRVALSDP